MSLIKRTSIRPHSPTDCAGEQLQRVATLALEAQAFGELLRVLAAARHEDLTRRQALPTERWHQNLLDDSAPVGSRSFD